MDFNTLAFLSKENAEKLTAERDSLAAQLADERQTTARLALAKAAVEKRAETAEMERNGARRDYYAAEAMVKQVRDEWKARAEAAEKKVGDVQSDFHRMSLHAEHERERAKAAEERAQAWERAAASVLDAIVPHNTSMPMDLYAWYIRTMPMVQDREAAWELFRAALALAPKEDRT